jgi:hypothetical protein
MASRGPHELGMHFRICPERYASSAVVGLSLPDYWPLTATERRYCAPAPLWEPPLARYYFHQADGQVSLDDVGTDLPDLSSLKKEMVRAAWELLRLRSTDLLWVEPWKIWATDQPGGQGTTVATIDLTASFIA